MRKWIVIIGIAVLAITGGTLFFSRPWESPVQRHIRGYREAERQIVGKKTFTDQMANVWRELIGRPALAAIDMSDPNNPHARQKRHEDALVALGYLEFREFYVTNRSLLAWLADQELPRDRLWQIAWSETNRNLLVIRAERHDMGKWQEMVNRINAGME